MVDKYKAVDHGDGIFWVYEGDLPDYSFKERKLAEHVASIMNTVHNCALLEGQTACLKQLLVMQNAGDALAATATERCFGCIVSRKG